MTDRIKKTAMSRILETTPLPKGSARKAAKAPQKAI